MKAQWGMLLVAMMACGAPPTSSTPAQPIFSNDSGIDAGTSDAGTSDGGTLLGGNLPDAGPDLGASKRIFVTSQKYIADIRVSGQNTIQAADALCNTVARGANLKGTFKAWLSTFNRRFTPETIDANAIERIADVGPWYQYNRAEQKLVKTFNNTANLLSTPLEPISFDENGSRISDGSLVWTGTSALGKARYTCDGFSTTSSNITGTVGRVGERTTWSDDGFASSCDRQHHFYCFQQ